MRHIRVLNLMQTSWDQLNFIATGVMGSKPRTPETIISLCQPTQCSILTRLSSVQKAELTSDCLSDKRHIVRMIPRQTGDDQFAF